MILWPILNPRIQSGDLMVTLDRWSVYSLSRWVHTLDHIWAWFSTIINVILEGMKWPTRDFVSRFCCRNCCLKMLTNLSHYGAISFQCRDIPWSNNYPAWRMSDIHKILLGVGWCSKWDSLLPRFFLSFSLEMTLQQRKVHHIGHPSSWH